MIELNHQLVPIEDNFLLDLKNRWFSDNHKHIQLSTYANEAVNWFKSTRLNNLHGWEKFPCTDVIMGCTHFIEAFILKYGWNGFQILENEYAYYRLMGKHGVEPDQLEANKPLIVSLPNWKTSDFPNNWDEVLRICEQRNIDIHIDFAWLTAARDINLNLDHPNIKSFAMSMSKYALQWNRIGIRWSRQRTMDSVTIFNQYYGDVNTGLASCGLFMLENIPRDYGWNTYGNKHYSLCTEHNLVSTKIFYVVRKPNDDHPYGIAKYLY